MRTYQQAMPMAEGRPINMPYTPQFIKQLDGSRFASTNCTPASSCMAAIRHYRGANPAGTAPWYPYPSWVRAVMGDTSGGTNLGQNSSIFYYKYAISFTVKYKQAWSEFKTWIRAGRGAVLQGAYDVVLPTVFDASGSFTGNHAVYVNAARYNTTYSRWEFYVGDPLADGRRTGIPKGYKWWPESLLRAFAGRLVVGSYRLGSGYVYAMYTKDTETTTVTAPTVTLRFSATRATPRVCYPRYAHATIRAKPTSLSTAVKVVRRGSVIFKHYQRTTGPLVGGSRVWLGNINGTQWVAYGRIRWTP